MENSGASGSNREYLGSFKSIRKLYRIVCFGEIVNNTYYARFIYRETITNIRIVDGVITICNIARGGAGPWGRSRGRGAAPGGVW